MVRPKSWLVTLSFFQICLPCPLPSLKLHYTNDRSSTGMLLAYVAVTELNTGILPCTPLEKTAHGLLWLSEFAAWFPEWEAMASFFPSAPSFISASETEVSCCGQCLVMSVKPVNPLLEERVRVGCQGAFNLQHRAHFLPLPTCTKRADNSFLREEDPLQKTCNGNSFTF